MTIAVLDYGMGNMLSVERALTHVGASARATSHADEIADADGLVVPGVGHFGACMQALVARRLDAAVRSFAGTGRPIFGVCLGMQVLFERSEEDDEPGLGLIAGGSARLADTEKVPHMGWNTVEWTASHPYVDGSPDGTRFYFVHSYAPGLIEGVTVGSTHYGRPFSSVVARGNLFATQFHPEKSGDAGLEIYERFAKAVASQ